MSNERRIEEAELLLTRVLVSEGHCTSKLLQDIKDYLSKPDEIAKEIKWGHGPEGPFGY